MVSNLWAPLKTFFPAGISGWERPMGPARGFGNVTVPLLGRLTFHLEDVPSASVDGGKIPARAVRLHPPERGFPQTPRGRA